MRTIRFGAAAVLAAVFCAASLVPAFAADRKVVLKVGLHNPQQHPLCLAVAEFGRIISERTGGRISTEIFYGGQLGNKNVHLQSLQTGVLDMSMIMGGVLVDYGAEDLAVFTLPYLFDSVEHARAFQNAPAGKKLIANIQESGTRMIGLGTYQESARNYFFTGKRVSTIADLSGMKIRCQEGSIYYETMEAFGASPVSIAFSELYSALQTGVVDGAEQPYSGFFTNQFQEVSKYYLLDKHEISPNIILFSESSWNKFSPEDRTLIQEAFDESVLFFNTLSDAEDAKLVAGMKAAGVDIYEPANPKEWQEAVTGIYEKYGARFKDVIEEIRNTNY